MSAASNLTPVWIVLDDVILNVPMVELFQAYSVGPGGASVAVRGRRKFIKAAGGRKFLTSKEELDAYLKRIISGKRASAVSRIALYDRIRDGLEEIEIRETPAEYKPPAPRKLKT